MRITVKTKGFDQAQRLITYQILKLEGQMGNFYPRQSARIKNAIQYHADPSYQGSPAKDEAIKSADNWNHERYKRHTCKIMAPLFANYRQYGCRGLKIAKLVDFLETDIKAMLETARQELEYQPLF